MRGVEVLGVGPQGIAGRQGKRSAVRRDAVREALSAPRHAMLAAASQTARLASSPALTGRGRIAQSEDPLRIDRDHEFAMLVDALPIASKRCRDPACSPKRACRARARSSGSCHRRAPASASGCHRCPGEPIDVESASSVAHQHAHHHRTGMPAARDQSAKRRCFAAASSNMKRLRIEPFGKLDDLLARERMLAELRPPTRLRNLQNSTSCVHLLVIMRQTINWCRRKPATRQSARDDDRHRPASFQ